MQRLLGPILYARTCPKNEWRFAIGVLIGDSTPDNAPPLEVEIVGETVAIAAPRAVADFTHEAAAVFWLWEVTLPRETTPRVVRYRIFAAGDAKVDGLPADPIPINVPAIGQVPKLAFFSCNGVDDPKHYRRLDDPEEVWRSVRKDVDDAKLHLLIGGGDQIYCDVLWETNPELRAYRKQKLTARIAAVPAPEFQSKMIRDYVALYCERWSLESEAGQIFARVPGIFTWDDHDIFDGWGSHAAEEQRAPYFQNVYAAARRSFVAFQLGGEDSPSLARSAGEKHFLQTLRIEAQSVELSIVLLDLRSDRTPDRIISNSQWDDLDRFLDDHRSGAGGLRHLVVVSSIPLVYMRFPAIADTFSGDLRDDLRDQWEHQAHRGERARMLMTLLEHIKNAKTSVTILSGDVHLGARAQIVSTDPRHCLHPGSPALIEQLTASGIVFPPPNRLQFTALRIIAKEGRDDLAGGISTTVVPVWTDTYLPERNWMRITSDIKRHRLWFQWVTAKKSIEPQIVVAPEGGA